MNVRDFASAPLRLALLVAIAVLTMVVLAVPRQPTAQAADPNVPERVQQELRALPPGSTIVDCLPGSARLPADMHRSRGFSVGDIGFYELSDGYCARDPNASPPRPVGDVNE